MLGSYMEDMGISSQQFEAACGVATARIKSEFHHTLFEQVWAADDYEIFKRMMIQKNIELQLQALELLQQRYGVLPDSLRPFQMTSTDKTKKAEGLESEDKVMEAVAQDSSHQVGRQKDSEELASGTRKSIAEHEDTVNALDKDDQELAEAIANSSVEKERLEAEKSNQQMLLVEHLNKVSITDHSAVLGSQPVPPAEDAPAAAAVSANLDEAELERRKEFLKLQRDKLLAMKREEREKQLEEAERQNMSMRPKTARAARSVFGNKGGDAAAAGSYGGLDPETLRARRALAEKLKQEVIGNQ